MYYKNCKGLRAKIYNSFIEGNNFDYNIICITKTWLNYTNSTSEIPETILYTIIRCDKKANASNKIRGKTAIIAVRNTYKVLKY